jgi:long-subunit fatty acid transport protein
MHAKQLIAIAAAALALGAFGTAAHAQMANDFSFSGMWKMDYIDKDKDSMVSKAEFMALMTKAWEMKAKEMKIKQDKMTAEEFKKFRDSFFPG